MAQDPNTSADNSTIRWSPRKRAIVSGLLVFHLAAVFLPPFAFQTSSSPGAGSPFAQPLMLWISPYADAAYLNHGYAFFAPDPGPSYLLRASMEFDDDRETIHRTMPDLNIDWPRLRYHRHFMLSEHLNGAFLPAEPPPEVAENPGELEYWQRRHQLYEARREAIVSHLKKKHGAARVNLRRVEHRLLDPYEITQSNRRIDAPETYIELSEAPMREVLP
jgi:hypothetical protein